MGLVSDVTYFLYCAVVRDETRSLICTSLLFGDRAVWICWTSLQFEGCCETNVALMRVNAQRSKPCLQPMLLFMSNWFAIKYRKHIKVLITLIIRRLMLFASYIITFIYISWNMGIHNDKSQSVSYANFYRYLCSFYYGYIQYQFSVWYDDLIWYT